MYRKLLVVIMVLAVAAAAFAECPMQRQGKGFKGYTSGAAGQPCPCPGMEKRDTPCPMVKDGNKSAPCRNMKQETACCGKDCMNRKKSGKVPCFNTMSGAKKPCPYATGATK